MTLSDILLQILKDLPSYRAETTPAWSWRVILNNRTAIELTPDEYQSFLQLREGADLIKGALVGLTPEQRRILISGIPGNSLSDEPSKPRSDHEREIRD
jgi:hypothetical protein